MRKVPNVNTHIFKQPNIPWSEFSEEAAAAFLLYDNLGDGLTGEEKVQMSSYIDAEVESGNHTLKDCEIIYSLSGSNSLVDYIGGKVSILEGDPTHSINGYSFTGTEYIRTNYVPSTDGVFYTSNDALSGVFIKALTVAGTFPMGGRGADTTTQISIKADAVASLAIVNNNSGAGSEEAYVGSPALMIAQRTTSIIANLVQNGVAGSNSIVVSVGLPNGEVWVGGRNLNGVLNSPITGTISSFIVAAAIGFDNVAYNTNLRALLTGLGTLP